MSPDWNQRYRSGETPWEKGEPHPELPFLLSAHRDIFERASRILVPGCGIGHDAALIAGCVTGEATGLDLATEAIFQASERYPNLGIDWQSGDLFKWEGAYDLVFEHTCFCAIPVESRPDYVAAMSRLIPSGGHLAGIFFLDPDHEGEEGPPFGVSVQELRDFLGLDFSLEWSRPPEKTFEGREGEGRELAAIWRRK